MNCNNTLTCNTRCALNALKPLRRQLPPNCHSMVSLSGMGELYALENRKLDKRPFNWRDNATQALLHNLSQSKEAHTTATRQTQGWRHPKSKGHGRQKRQVLCLGNVVVSLRLPNVVERSNKSHSKRRQMRGQGFCPFLRWLCIEEGITPLVWSKVAEAGIVSGSFAIARQTLLAWGITISLKRIERLTYHFSKWGLSRRNSHLFHFRQGTLPTTPVLKDQRVVIS